MKLENIKMPGYNTSMMGVIKGVLDFYQQKKSDAMAFGGSGHAFLINIHENICPSGPYCWNHDGFIRLVRNLGLEMTDLGFFHAEHGPQERQDLENTVKGYLDRGIPCSVENMDNQIVYGYEEDRLLLTQPWGECVDVTPATLSFGSWKEFGREIHANFYAFKKVEGKEDPRVIRESLEFAVDLFDNHDKYSWNKYGIGLAAYDNWAQGAEKGHGSSHGNWWNGTVWSECRKMAAGYFNEITGKVKGAAAEKTGELSRAYAEIAGNLMLISNKDMAVPDKLLIIGELKSQEEKAVNIIKDLLGSLD